MAALPLWAVQSYLDRGYVTARPIGEKGLRGELHAAAALYQEAAEYAVRVGLPYDRRYQARAAETWVRCADKYVETGMPVEMAENALLAAASQYSAVSAGPATQPVIVPCGLTAASSFSP